MNSFGNMNIYNLNTSIKLLLSIQHFSEEENHLTKHNQKQKKITTHKKITEIKSKIIEFIKLNF